MVNHELDNLPELIPITPETLIALAANRGTPCNPDNGATLGLSPPSTEPVKNYRRRHTLGECDTPSLSYQDGTMGSPAKRPRMDSAREFYPGPDCPQEYPVIQRYLKRHTLPPESMRQSDKEYEHECNTNISSDVVAVRRSQQFHNSQTTAHSVNTEGPLDLTLEASPLNLSAKDVQSPKHRGHNCPVHFPNALDRHDTDERRNDTSSDIIIHGVSQCVVRHMPVGSGLSQTGEIDIRPQMDYEPNKKSNSPSKHSDIKTNDVMNYVDLHTPPHNHLQQRQHLLIEPSKSGLTPVNSGAGTRSQAVYRPCPQYSIPHNSPPAPNSSHHDYPRQQDPLYTDRDNWSGSTHSRASPSYHQHHPLPSLLHSRVIINNKEQHTEEQLRRWDKQIADMKRAAHQNQNVHGQTGPHYDTHDKQVADMKRAAHQNQNVHGQTGPHYATHDEQVADMKRAAHQNQNVHGQTAPHSDQVATSRSGPEQVGPRTQIDQSHLDQSGPRFVPNQVSPSSQFHQSAPRSHLEQSCSRPSPKYIRSPSHPDPSSLRSHPDNSGRGSAAEQQTQQILHQPNQGFHPDQSEPRILPDQSGPIFHPDQASARHVLANMNSHGDRRRDALHQHHGPAPSSDAANSNHIQSVRGQSPDLVLVGVEPARSTQNNPQQHKPHNKHQFGRDGEQAPLFSGTNVYLPDINEPGLMVAAPAPSPYGRCRVQQHDENSDEARPTHQPQQMMPAASSHDKYQRQRHPMMASQSAYPSSTATQPGRTLQSEESIISNDILYMICKLCNMSYGNVYSMKKHFQRMHSREFMFSLVEVETISRHKEVRGFDMCLSDNADFVKAQHNRSYNTPILLTKLGANSHDISTISKGTHTEHRLPNYDNSPPSNGQSHQSHPLKLAPSSQHPHTKPVDNSSTMHRQNQYPMHYSAPTTTHMNTNNTQSRRESQHGPSPYPVMSQHKMAASQQVATVQQEVCSVQLHHHRDYEQGIGTRPNVDRYPNPKPGQQQGQGFQQCPPHRHPAVTHQYASANNRPSMPLRPRPIYNGNPEPSSQNREIRSHLVRPQYPSEPRNHFAPYQPNAQRAFLPNNQFQSIKYNGRQVPRSVPTYPTARQNASFQQSETYHSDTVMKRGRPPKQPVQMIDLTDGSDTGKKKVTLPAAAEASASPSETVDVSNSACPSDNTTGDVISLHQAPRHQVLDSDTTTTDTKINVNVAHMSGCNDKLDEKDRKKDFILDMINEVIDNCFLDNDYFSDDKNADIFTFPNTDGQNVLTGAENDISISAKLQIIDNVMKDSSNVNSGLIETKPNTNQRNCLTVSASICPVKTTNTDVRVTAHELLNLGTNLVGSMHINVTDTVNMSTTTRTVSSAIESETINISAAVSSIHQANYASTVSAAVPSIHQANYASTVSAAVPSIHQDNYASTVDSQTPPIKCCNLLAELLQGDQHVCTHGDNKKCDTEAARVTANKLHLSLEPLSQFNKDIFKCIGNADLNSPQHIKTIQVIRKEHGHCDNMDAGLPLHHGHCDNMDAGLPLHHGKLCNNSHTGSISGLSTDGYNHALPSDESINIDAPGHSEETRRAYDQGQDSNRCDQSPDEYNGEPIHRNTDQTTGDGKIREHNKVCLSISLASKDVCLNESLRSGFKEEAEKDRACLNETGSRDDVTKEQTHLPNNDTDYSSTTGADHFVNTIPNNNSVTEPAHAMVGSQFLINKNQPTKPLLKYSDTFTCTVSPASEARLAEDITDNNAVPSGQHAQHSNHMCRISHGAHPVHINGLINIIQPKYDNTDSIHIDLSTRCLSEGNNIPDCSVVHGKCGSGIAHNSMRSVVSRTKSGAACGGDETMSCDVYGTSSGILPTDKPHGTISDVQPKDKLQVIIGVVQPKDISQGTISCVQPKDKVHGIIGGIQPKDIPQGTISCVQPGHPTQGTISDVNPKDKPQGTISCVHPECCKHGSSETVIPNVTHIGVNNVHVCGTVSRDAPGYTPVAGNDDNGKNRTNVAQLADTRSSNNNAVPKYTPNICDDLDPGGAHFNTSGVHDDSTEVCVN